LRSGRGLGESFTEDSKKENHQASIVAEFLHNTSIVLVVIKLKQQQLITPKLYMCLPAENSGFVYFDGLFDYYTAADG
jgi:hypothetical protein